MVSVLTLQENTAVTATWDFYQALMGKHVKVGCAKGIIG